MVAAIVEQTLVEEVASILSSTVMSGYIEILARFHDEIPHGLYRQIEKLAEDVEDVINTMDVYEDDERVG